MMRLPDLLLAVACPPLYLGRRRRWVGAVLMGLVWVLAVALTGLSFYAMAQEGIQDGIVLLAGGLLFWLVSGLLAWLWSRQPPLGAATLGLGLVCLRDRPPPARPRLRLKHTEVPRFLATSGSSLTCIALARRWRAA
jgi:hypothetical protein